MTFTIRRFDKERPLGETLQALRKAARVTLSELESKTKIRRCFLEALEQGNYDKLPEPLYTKKYLRAYVQTLGGNETYFLERFDEERGTCDFVGSARLPRRRASRSQFLVPSRYLKVIGLLFIAVSVCAYIGNQMHSIISPPTVTVTGPEDGLKSDLATIFVEGAVENGVTVKINSMDVVLSQEGTFKEEVALMRGLNTIHIEAKKRYSRTQDIYRRVVLRQENEPLGITEQ